VRIATRLSGNQVSGLLPLSGEFLKRRCLGTVAAIPRHQPKPREEVAKIWAALRRRVCDSGVTPDTPWANVATPKLGLELRETPLMKTSQSVLVILDVTDRPIAEGSLVEVLLALPSTDPIPDLQAEYDLASLGEVDSIHGPFCDPPRWMVSYKEEVSAKKGAWIRPRTLFKRGQPAPKLRRTPTTSELRSYSSPI